MTNKHRGKISSVVAGVAGAAVIAGIEIAMELRDKKTREKVKKMLINVKDQAIDYVDTLEIETKKGGEKNGK